jgi:hypothetical protein
LHRRLEGDSFRLDPTLHRIAADEAVIYPEVRAWLDERKLEADNALWYLALADGPYGRYRIMARFGHPEHPTLFCLDGPKGPAASPHRNGDAVLCLYYITDPPERRWTIAQGLIRLLDLARQHLACEYLFRLGMPWPIEEAPHGETEPAGRAPGLAVEPLRHPGRNDHCPCGSGLKAKRCCFR